MLSGVNGLIGDCLGPSQTESFDRNISKKPSLARPVYCNGSNFEAEFFKLREKEDARKQQMELLQPVIDRALIEEASRYGSVLNPWGLRVSGSSSPYSLSFGWTPEGEYYDHSGVLWEEIQEDTLLSMLKSIENGEGCWDLVEVNRVNNKARGWEWGSVLSEPQEARGDENSINVRGCGEKHRSGEIFRLEGFGCFRFGGRKVEDGVVWVFTGVYGPFTKDEWECLWEEIGAIRGIWEEPWCVGGDFNIIFSQRERSRQGRITSAMRRFAQIIDDLGLVDLPLQEGMYTWSGGPNNQFWARLDQFSCVLQRRLPRPVSDHFPVLLEGGVIRRGPSPFRFENMWLKVEGFKDLIYNWWEVFGRLEYNKVVALQLVDYWDLVESERSLSEEETTSKKEAKEMLSGLLWKKPIGGSYQGSYEEKEVREGVANAYQHLLTENSKWKADIERLQLEQITPGLDGVTVVFWQNCWDFVKEEVLELFKEFCEQSSFIKSLNNTFLVLLPKKGGAEDLGDFRPISLLEGGRGGGGGGGGGLYKLLAKVLANGLKKVIGKVVSPDQNAFVMGRQIFDASLIANEVIDSWQKREEKGLICHGKNGVRIKVVGLDVELHFHNQVFGLVNGVPVGFFPSSKGLRQGDPLSPYLFVMGMEVLSALIRRVVEGDFLLGCRIRGGRRQPVHISHLLFADDTIVFCEAKKEHITHLSWILFWFEAASGLRINLDKSEIIPIGEVEEMEGMAAELGCRVGYVPTVYLGLPLGAPNKAASVWDGVEERVRRRLALWKR
ncbi:Transposon TX1 uncharacterized 149 kDa protein [Vitis vinifera]|uniref:Transposon TX1 uncharacterized 149 kDa protein n=1 Tax=Vitis vinifera TaxID=29760 RepID=A0A438J5E7_VITVI|nr:Transposon TX1 uncharacterized 149 kDa protein [Vitis vinifera]